MQICSPRLAGGSSAVVRATELQGIVFLFPHIWYGFIMMKKRSHLN